MSDSATHIQLFSAYDRQEQTNKQTNTQKEKQIDWQATHAP